jgi:hypothetical protein
VKASVARQPKKVYCEMIGMGAKSITIGRAVTADFFFDCRAANMFYLIDPVGDMLLALKVGMVPQNSIGIERRLAEG